MRTTSSRRDTRQRRVILEELRKVTSHPTADDLYHMVRQRLPRISMGTVYRNLELMARQGLILRLDISGTQKRFDGNPKNHYHVRCLSCGKVADTHTKHEIPIDNVIKEITDFEIIGHRLEFIGLCPQCRRKESGNLENAATA